MENDIQPEIAAVDEGPLLPPPAPRNPRGPRRVRIRPRRIPWRLRNRPKRPRTAFVIFANERRPTVRRANPQMTIPEVSIRLGDEWRSKTAAERRPFYERSFRDRDRYQRQTIEWRRDLWNGRRWVAPPEEPV